MESKTNKKNLRVGDIVSLKTSFTIIDKTPLGYTMKTNLGFILKNQTDTGLIIISKEKAILFNDDHYIFDNIKLSTLFDNLVLPIESDSSPKLQTIFKYNIGDVLICSTKFLIVKIINNNATILPINEISETLDFIEMELTSLIKL